MRNIEEKVNIVIKRANQLNEIKKRRSRRILTLCSAAACLVLIVGTALAMPSIMAGLSLTEYRDVTGFASIFSSGTAMGYLLVALLGFMLGIFLTILCVYLHKRSVEDKHND
ncbi:MAG: DUF4179 domain-containing protein [Lachnospiraceae bacterium]